MGVYIKDNHIAGRCCSNTGKSLNKATHGTTASGGHWLRAPPCLADCSRLSRIRPENYVSEAHEIGKETTKARQLSEI